MKRSVFFSWQADTNTKTGRNLIERALEQALKELSKDPAVTNAERDLYVDRDTAGVPGSPPIVETIFNKIDNAFAFVPDLTFVGRRLDGRPTPNPNVLIEYGWGLKSLGFNRLIPVMNVAYGEPTAESMPFDLRHLRHPISFSLREDASEKEVAAVKAELAKAFRIALGSILNSAALNELGLDRSFGENGTSIIPEGCFRPERIQVHDDRVSVAGFLDGAAHVSNLTPGGKYTDAPVAEEFIRSQEKLFGGSFLFCGATTVVLGGTSQLPGRRLLSSLNGCWSVVDGTDHDLLVCGEQPFTGRLGSGRVLLLDDTGNEGGKVQLHTDDRFHHEGVHTIRRQGEHLYLYWVPAPRLHEGAVARFMLDGTLDGGFGTNGIVSLPTEHGARGRILNFLQLNDVLLQPDGKILVGGYGNDANIVRLMPDGTKDLSFGIKGSIVFRADDRSSLKRLCYDENGVYAFGDQNSRNDLSPYVAKINHSGKLEYYIHLSGKGISETKDVAVHRGHAFVLLHFDRDSQMHNCAAIAKLRL